MATYEYTGRQYDFLALQNISAVRETQLELELAPKSGFSSVIAGPQKLAQRWLLEFLTERGSMPGLPERGTNFMTLVRQGRLRTEAAFIAAFNFAAYDARVNLGKEEDATWRNDERIGDVIVESVAFLPGFAQIRFIISSLAGPTRNILLPIPTIPQNVA